MNKNKRMEYHKLQQKEISILIPIVLAGAILVSVMQEYGYKRLKYLVLAFVLVEACFLIQIAINRKAMKKIEGYYEN